MQSAASKSQIVDYYEQSEIDYRLVWHLSSQRAMHYGFWGKTARTLARALHNENKTLAALAHVTRQDHVLDAGCGVGGSSLYLAREFGCQVTGISLLSQQVRAAEQEARRRHLEELAHFQQADFTAMPFEDNTFDVVWAIESVCHASEKQEFLWEAFRVLKPGGRLIVADYFLNRKPTKAEKEILRQWLSGWAVESIDSVTDFTAKAERVGFINSSMQNFTSATAPSSRRMYWYSFVGIPGDAMSRFIGWRKGATKGNFHALRYQYQAFHSQLCQYGVFTATRPR